MSILSDLKDEVESYPHEFLDIEIVEVAPATGSAINKDEPVTFKFQVTNRGALDVENVSFLIEGLNGTQVKEGNGAGAAWGTEYTTTPGYFPRLPAHQPNDPVLSNGSPYTFRPRSTSTAAQDLVRVSVAGWDTDLDHILMSHSRADDQAGATHQAVVHPK
ncbi:hypothetical protein [Jannaschia sp. R86511]|uniref:hypothetical protein n=1 Tax=Jannaschia sp. R86511 TaxID=3093853 RepID=UPI0036D34A19